MAMVDIDPVVANENAAQVLADAQLWLEAASALTRAARAEPANIARWLKIAQWQRQCGEARLAAKTLQTALRLNRKNKNSRSRLQPDDDAVLLQTLAEVHLEAQNWEDAIAVCNLLIEASSQHHYAQEMVATALLQSGRMDEAEAVMRNLIAQSPRDPLHRLRLATLLQLQGKLGDATREFERVIHLHPDFALAAEAREAVENLDRMQTQQILLLASEQLAFRRQLESDMESALEILNFHLSESGYDSLKHMIWDGSIASEPPLRFH